MMKTTLVWTMILFTLSLSIGLPHTAAEDTSEWKLPEGAKTRLGKGWISGNVTYSPDGTLLAVASSIGIWLYDAETYQERALLTGHTSNVHGVSFSPDGKTLASVNGDSSDDTVRLWDVATGTQKGILTHSGGQSVSFSPDGKTIATADGSGVRLWDVATGTLKHTLSEDTYIYWSYNVAFSPDGTTLASVSGDFAVRLWDVATGKQKGTLTGHTYEVYSVSFSPDGTTLASGSGDYTVRLWDVATGTQKGILTEFGGGSASFSPDGKTIATGDWDGTVHLWDVATGTQKQTLTGHTGRIRSVSFSPDGKTIATDGVHLDGTVRLWDVATETQKGTLTGHIFDVRSVPFSPDGRTLASASGDGTVRLWDVATETQKGALQHTSWVHSVSFSPDGKTIASGGWDRTVYLWDVATGSLKHTFTGHTGLVNSVSFSPDGKTIASGGFETVHLWDVATGSLKHTFTGHSFDVLSVSFSPDGKTIASGSADSTVRLWDVATGTQKGTLTGHTDWVYSVSFSPDGKTIASGSINDTVRLWDVATATQKGTLTGHTGSFFVSFSPDGKTIASGGWGEVRLWDVTTGTQKGTLTGHIGAVYSVSFSPDGTTLASGSSDGTVLLWDLTLYLDIDQVSTDDPDPLDPITPTDPVVSDRDIRIRGGATEEFTDSQGRIWWGAQQTNQSWGGVVGQLPRVAVDNTLTANAEAQAIAAGYAPELFHAVSWALYPDTIHYQFNTGNGVFDVTYLVGEHWRDQDRGYDIIIEGEIVEPLYIAPGMHEIDIKTYQGIEVTDDTLDIQFAGNSTSSVSDWNPMFSALEIVPVTLGPTTPIDTDETPVTIVPSRTGSEYQPDEWTLGLWHFDGENIADSSTNGVQGVIEGNAQWSTNQDWHEDAKPGHSFSFDGNTLITLGHADVLIPTDAITVEAWVYPQDLSGWRLIGTNWDSPPGAYHLGVSGGYPQFEINTDKQGIAFVIAEVPLELGQWSHLAGTYDSNLNQVKLYVNGVEVASMEHNGKLADNDFDVIIGSKNNRRYKWNGLIDEVRISSIARQPEALSPNLAKPTMTYLKEDVNRDGIVDLQDLMLVAADLTKIGEYATDVNEDGAVNIADLVLVAGAQGSNTTASVPALHHAKAYTFSRADVEMWIAQAKQLNLTDPKALRGIRFLEHLLLTITPEKTALLTNYPNPFNPETWIPYQLAKSAKVKLTIYAADGKLIRALTLGHQAAGVYHNRNRAAYWDGKNEVGESVASGIYFYSLTAGDFSATRKMLILK